MRSMHGSCMLEANARDLKHFFDPANTGFLSYPMVWWGAICL